MMRPPPGGMPPQTMRASAPQIRRMASASRGRISGIGPIGAAAAAGAAAGASFAPAAGAPLPIAATALRHRGESCAALRCRHCRASAPPGCTPGQRAMKSERHAARTALRSSALGAAASFAAGADGDMAAAGASLAPPAGAPLPIAATALRHRGESCSALRSRHCRASAPPGLTPGQCATKSERHAARTALRSSALGAAASLAAGADGDAAAAGAGACGFFGATAGAAGAAGAGSAGAVSAAAGGAGAAGSDCRAAWQGGERLPTLA